MVRYVDKPIRRLRLRNWKTKIETKCVIPIILIYLQRVNLSYTLGFYNKKNCLVYSVHYAKFKYYLQNTFFV